MSQEFVYLYKSKRVSFKKRGASTKEISIFINDTQVPPSLQQVFSTQIFHFYIYKHHLWQWIRLRTCYINIDQGLAIYSPLDLTTQKSLVTFTKEQTLVEPIMEDRVLHRHCCEWKRKIVLSHIVSQSLIFLN